jgi:methyl-accepting chemotaxis protein
MTSKMEDMTSKMEDMSSTIETMSSTMQHTSSIIDTLKHKFSIIEVENLKLINRILEAEISLERTKNILVRKHISFPFISTLLSNRFL